MEKGTARGRERKRKGGIRRKDTRKQCKEEEKDEGEGGMDGKTGLEVGKEELIKEDRGKKGEEKKIRRRRNR